MADSLEIKVESALDRSNVARLLGELADAVRRRPQRVVVDLGTVERFDSAGLGGVVEGLRRARATGVEVRLRGLSQPMLDFFSLLSIERLTAGAAPRARLDPISRVGAAVLPVLRGTAAIARMALRVVESLLLAPLRGHGLRVDRCTVELDHAANGALPIVALISFLLGLILAMQAWVQLRVWGAEIYMADMVGVSVLTEIGPLMTAIVLAARSGSSNAAQLGAMVVGEEIDALRQMGVDPIRFLVVPKVLALALAALALCVVFDVVAIFGGAAFAWLAAGIEPAAFREQLQVALDFADFAVAASKCLVFGLCIGIVGCALGLRVEGGSDGVGRATTNTVVSGIFVIIVVDALFVSAQRLLLA